MYKTKLLASILLIAAVLFAQVGVAAAAPAQDASFDATIQTIVPEKDANGVITVVVTYTDTNGATQTVRISEETAASLGLLTLDETSGLPVVDETTGLPVVDDTKIDTTVTINSTDVLPDQTTEEEPIHPIAALLASFFDVDGSTVNELHQDGFGFGLIAQALWMSKNIGGIEGGDIDLAGCILDAKKSGNYDTCNIDFGDDPVPTNWGQFKKVFSEKKNNLGFIVSGKAENENANPAANKEHGTGKDNNPGKGKDNNNGKGKP